MIQNMKVYVQLGISIYSWNLEIMAGAFSGPIKTFCIRELTYRKK